MNPYPAYNGRLPNQPLTNQTTAIPVNHVFNGNVPLRQVAGTNHITTAAASSKANTAAQNLFAQGPQSFPCHPHTTQVHSALTDAQKQRLQKQQGVGIAPSSNPSNLPKGWGR